MYVSVYVQVKSSLRTQQREREMEGGRGSSEKDPLHVVHSYKVPSGDSPYVRAKNAQVTLLTLRLVPA